jgi:hypothetical protein
MLRAMKPTPPTPAPAKVRPSWGWFVLGGGLLVAAVASGIGLFVWTLSSFLATDGSLPVDGQAHVVEVDHDDDVMLWTDALVHPPTCEARDADTGDSLTQTSPTGSFSFSRSTGDREWEGFSIVAGGADRVEITCTGQLTPAMASERVEVGPAPSIGGFGLGILLTIGVPLLLGGTGIVVLIVTGVLWSTRATTRR